MSSIEKALQALAEAMKENDAVARINVSITLKKPKPDKATPKA